MKLSFLVSTSQLNSQQGKILGTGTVEGVRHLAQLMKELNIEGNIYDLPNGSKNPGMASPFSINSGFALNAQELNLFKIPELMQTPALLQYAEKTQNNYLHSIQNSRSVSYTLKSTLLPSILEQCYSIFLKQNYKHREEQLELFKEKSSFWIEDYALYQCYQEYKIELENLDYRDKNGSLVKDFISSHVDRIHYYQYVQMLCFEQRKQLLADMRKMGIGLILNLPFGIEFESADVFFNSDTFQSDQQVGCSPEPQYGYPEQAWGVAVYKEQSEGLNRYLKERMSWLSQMGDGVFIDHLVGWCGQYVLPRQTPSDPNKHDPVGHFLTEDSQLREQNIRWFLEIVLKSGLSIKGEIAGDFGRVESTRKVVDEMVIEGKDIMAMAIPRWESYGSQLKLLKDYKKATLLMLETHDTSTLLQFILNQKGDHQDFESPGIILDFCRRVLSLPLFLVDIPLKLEEISTDFVVEILRRVLQGSRCDEVMFSLPSFISLLSEEYRNASKLNNINIKPGSNGKIGNEWNNWSFFSPPIENLVQNEEVKREVLELGIREFIPVTPFEYFNYKPHEESPFEVIFATPDNRQILYQDHQRVWKLWVEGDIKPDFELLIRNKNDFPSEDRIDIGQILNLNFEGSYTFLDLKDQENAYTYSTSQLREEQLYIYLEVEQTHHFVVFKGE
ncbi:MAG: 4-alpha-glucanotransferase [Proteobacteria bacterium]|nr:4-alpha-glucanotransferase [Pseudomonadota bacterium]